MLQTPNAATSLQSQAPRSAKAEWRRYWLLTLVACVGGAVPTAHYYTLGLFFAPLKQAFGWSRSELSLTLLVGSIVCIILAPFVGIAVDRWGSRRVGIPGVIVYCSGLFLNSLAGPSIWSYWGSCFIVALGQSCLVQSVWVTAVASRFVIARGFATAVTLCGASLGAFVVPIIAEFAISHYGWRAGYVALGAILPAVALPLLFFCFPDKPAEPAVASRAVEATSTSGLHWKEGLRSPYFWFLGGIGFFVTLSTQALMVHFVPIVTAKGLDRTTAAAIVGTVGIASMAGRLFEGILLDRFRPQPIASVSLLMLFVTCLFVHFYDGSAVMASFIAVSLGLALGAETNIVAYLATRYLGMRNYGVLFGILAALINLGAGVGPLAAGAIYDTFGNYDIIIIAAVCISLFFSITVSQFGKYPDFSEA